MLVLTRAPVTGQDTILIGDNIIVTINQVRGQRVRVGIKAPDSVRLVRGELKGRPQPFQRAA